MTHLRITVDPAIMVGKPVIKGTRIPVENILRKLGAGWGIPDILDAYPNLTAEDVYASVAYAADSDSGGSEGQLRQYNQGGLRGLET